MKQPCASYLESLARKVGPILEVLSILHQTHIIATRMFEISLVKKGAPSILRNSDADLDTINSIVDQEGDLHWTAIEIDSAVRRHVCKALSENNAEKLVGIFPAVMEMYSASGFMAECISEVKSQIEEQVSDFGAEGWSFRAAVATLTLITSKHPVLIVMSHLTNIAIDVLLKKEDEIAIEIRTKFPLEAIPEGYLRDELDAALRDKDVIRAAAIVVYTWRRMVLAASEYAARFSGITGLMLQWARLSEVVTEALKKAGAPQSEIDSIN